MHHGDVNIAPIEDGCYLTLIADKDYANAFARCKYRSLNDLTRSGIAPHGVDGDSHGAVALPLDVFLVNYLAAAINEGIVANATLLRRGKELVFAEVDVATEAGKSIAHITTSVRGRFGAEAAELAKSPGDRGDSDPGAMGPHLHKMPFIGSRGIFCEHMTGGTSRLVMPYLESNADADGGVHEGAVLALMDTTGAIFVGNIDHDAGTASGIAFGYNGGSSIWSAEQIE